MRPLASSPLVVRSTVLGGPKPAFCVPLVANNTPQLIQQAHTCRNLAPDLIEWRADAFSDITPNGIASSACALRSAVAENTVLFTLRAKEEGGLQAIGQDSRTAIIQAVLATATVDLIDIELSNGAAFNTGIIQAARRSNVRVVMSFHDFEGTPPDDALLQSIESMVYEGADVAKIACMPRNQADVLRLLGVTGIARTRFPNVSLCTMSMGALGSISRVAGFLFGNDMAFAIGQTASAPGQIPISDARKIAESLLAYA